MSLKELYKNEIKQKLAEEFDIKNPMLIPALEKITISVGLGEGGKDKKYIDKPKKKPNTDMAISGIYYFDKEDVKKSKKIFKKQ